MQLTRLDRWLRERYVYETHIYTLSRPARLPKAVDESKDAPSPTSNFKHHFITHHSKAAEELIRQLKANNQKFSTRIVDRDKWFVRFIAPKGKSVTWSIVLAVLGGISSCIIGNWIYRIVTSAEMQRIFAEAWKMIKSS